MFMAAVSAQISESDGVMKIMQVLRDYCAPDAIGPINQDVARFLHFKRTALRLGKQLARLDLSPRKAESRTQISGSTPRTFVSIPCMQNASLSQSDKSLVLASAQGNLGMAAAARKMRRLFGRV